MSEVQYEGDPLDNNVLYEYKQSLLNVICHLISSDGNLNDYSTILEKCLVRNCAANSTRLHNEPEALIHSSPFVVVTRSNGCQVASKKRTRMDVWKWG
jgi:hypothetical protein